MKSREILIVDAENNFEERLTLILNEQELVSIGFRYDNEQYVFTDQNYFACLILVRDFFSKKNKKVVCNGSRYDVYPSGMLSQMSKGLKVYQLEIGKRSSLSSVIETFGPTEVEKIGSLDDQEEFYKKWLESLG